MVKVKDYKLKKSFRVPNIDVILREVKDDMRVYHSLQDLEERVVKYMNEQHAQFLNKLTSEEKTDSEIEGRGDTGSMTKKSYEVAVTPKQTISIKCTKKNCRFRIYFTGTQSETDQRDFTEITQRVPFYVSWHSYPLH